ncbi:RES family NAD+ phosphorylase [Massilia sp. GCM10023247]|uniref:RES family NAD+ phosphorylase n=1 Tax=Massilia sp. GCM10023247 TaxID=3252643 RepID=UPI00361AB88F
MTGAPPSSLSLDCPLPPPDLCFRQIPTITFDLAVTPLLRVHQSRYSPLFFNRRSTSPTVYRFDAPNDEYGVLYASPEFEACMAETLIRERFESGPLILDEAEITSRSVSRLGIVDRTQLSLVDLTAALFPIGGTSAITSTSAYQASNAWSRAFHTHPAEYDGLYFRSRYSNLPSVALFDRVEATVEGTTLLSTDPRLVAFLEKYQIGLV